MGVKQGAMETQGHLTVHRVFYLSLSLYYCLSGAVGPLMVSRKSIWHLLLLHPQFCSILRYGEEKSTRNLERQQTDTARRHPLLVH